MAQKANNVGLLPKLQRQFAFLHKEVLAILLFGSHSLSQESPRSDIDICLVAPQKKPADLLRKVFQQMDTKGYDIYCFQELPLHLQKEVMENHKIIFVQDEGELQEYFYFYRKLWAEQKHRHMLSRKELLAMRDTAHSDK